MESIPNNSWDFEYETGRLGDEGLPEYGLLKFFNQIPRGRVLDLGGGDGRNSLIFAQNGYKVKLVDCSKVAIQKCRKKANDLNIKIEIEQRNIEDYIISPNTYSLIIASFLLQAFKLSVAEKIINSMVQGVCKNGFLYVSVLSTEDSAFEQRKRELEQVEKNTFYLADRKIYCHHFTKTELLDYFPDLELFYLSESRFQRFSEHKADFPYQANIEFLGKKPF
ncbi:MAG: class I SAM-dependent methyltransferase [bacterium]|nr:MAG: class I SAM-dependent methyltransferase [bacterium]